MINVLTSDASDWCILTTQYTEIIIDLCAVSLEPEKIQRVRIEHDDKVKEYMKQKRIQARKQRQQENEEKRREQERIALNKRRVEEEAKSAVTEKKRAAKQKQADAAKTRVRNRVPTDQGNQLKFWKLFPIREIKKIEGFQPKSGK